jgi:type IV pilus assembly protein PilQ
MGNKISLFRCEIRLFLICLGIGALLLGACATPPPTSLEEQETGVPTVESINVKPSPEQTVVEIVNSRPTHYTAFELIDPPRLILDVRGEPGANLQPAAEVNDGNVKEIRFEKGQTQAMTTRVVVSLARAVNYKVAAQDKVITLTLEPKAVRESEHAIGKQTQGMAGQEGVKPAEPRIFFKPRPISLNQVLGVDFTMLDHGKSLLVVTTDKRVPYNLERKGPKTLLLTLQESTIPPLLMRRLDSRYFEGTVDRVKANVADNTVSLLISLREMVPFHVKQTDSAVSIDFGPTSVGPPEKRLMPLTVTEAQIVRAPGAPKNAREAPAPAHMAPVQKRVAPSTGEPTKAYKGEPMYLDFVNAEVTNILRLINEVSEENIIWDPAISGKKVSMVLKNVPWDQALDLILINNDLAKRYLARNIVWVTTKDKMAKIEAEERKTVQEAEARMEAERQRKLEEQKRAQELEPLITEYIPIDFASADEIKQHIVLSDRGSMSTDARTNTIIIKDIPSSVEDAKKTVKQFDTPVKQIMIEARIVDATDNFTRDLGVRWGNTATGQAGFSGERRSNTGVPFGIPTDATNYSTGSDALIGGDFSTNGPEGWIPNIGIGFGYLTSSMLGAVTIDASLALAETEGQVRIISAPKVIASNGESATIARGTTFYLEAAENVEPKEVTAQLSLEVTPTVSYNDFVTMELTVKDEQETLRGKTGKDLSTKLMIKSGETIVIGGIYSEDRTEDESGIPYLRKIPILGWLFKAQKRTSEKAELLIFLTPKVLPPPGKAKAAI